MRRRIQEDQKRMEEERNRQLSEKMEYGHRLFEKWSGKKIGKGMDKIMEQDEKKAVRLAMVLENQEKHLQSLTETQISNDFQTTPENVLRVIRLGYPNSVRGEIFQEFPMVTAHDSIYYLSPVYTSTARGATSGNITHESDAWRYATEYEEDTVGTGDGSTTTFPTTTSELSNPPLRPFHVLVMVGGEPVASDDGSGNLVGDALDSASTNTVDYTTGDITINFDTAPASGEDVVVQYAFDSEVDTQYSDMYSVQLQLRDYQMRAHPFPLYVSWSKMTELLLGTTLDIDAEENLISGAADELKKALDFHAVKMGYRYSNKNTVRTFNADFASAGADSEEAHAQSVTKLINQMGQTVYNNFQRGGVNVLVAGTDVVSFLTLHRQFSMDGNQPEVGIYRVGTLLGKPVYQAPNNIVPSDELLGVWRNPNEDGDVSIAFGSLVPLYQTQTLEYRQAYSETGLYHFGDWKALQPKYITRAKFNNLSG